MTTKPNSLLEPRRIVITFFMCGPLKVLWAPSRPAVLAVATIQLVRIYDLLLDADNFVEELVLPVGNVEDIELINGSTTDEMWLMVLSNSGHLYEHKLTAKSAENTSFFLTNTVTPPRTQQALGAGVSVHYSSVSELLFLSLDKGTWFVPIEKGNLPREDLLEMATPVHCWQESSGVMACLSYPVASSLIFVYPTLEQLLVQRVQLKRSAFTHALFTGSSIYTPISKFCFRKWSTLPDLWIENTPSEMCAQAEKEQEEPDDELEDNLEIFYDVHDLNVRLNSVGSMPVTAIQQFTLTVKIGDPNIIVRGVRIELPAERGRGPSEVCLIFTRSQSLELYGIVCLWILYLYCELSLRSDKNYPRSRDHRNITFTFSGRTRSQVGMTVVSVRLYGISKREFGIPRSHLVARVPLSLPHKFLLNVVRMLTTLTTRNLLIKLVSYQHAPQLRRQSKKVLLAMFNGDKQKYREVRDQHLMRAHIELLKKKYSQHSHQQLSEMVEIVTGVGVITCHALSDYTGGFLSQLNWLLQLACRVGDAVSCCVIDLLVSAIRETPEMKLESLKLVDKIIAEEENRCLLMMLLVRYLIGSDENRRWLMHGLLRSTIQLASRPYQIMLLRILWTNLWPIARGLGDHAAQLADILSTYASRLFSSAEMQSVSIRFTISRYKDGHAGWYRQMTGLGLGWKTMLMDTSPCLVCFSRKVPHTTIKLNSIKQEARFSANAMMLKLTCHYEISKVIIKLTDIKRILMASAKMCCTYICLIESAVELKTCPDLWQRASTCSVTANDTEVVLHLAIPVVTASLVIQFSELTESRQNQELHCPRCSSVVQPNPGLCEHCGENVFQCVKCRAINYDEKDPFLCQSCGFCKYARMDISLVCRPLPGVQPITTDIERAACVDSMTQLLSAIEQTRSQLAAGRALCELLWMQYRPLPPISYHVESPEAANILIAGLPPITLHEELCMQTQQLIAFREELRGYDQSIKTPPLSNCFGCLRASILHSLAILQSSCDDECCLERLLNSDIVFVDLVSQDYLCRLLWSLVLLRKTRAVEASRSSLERLLRRISAKDPLMLMRAAVQSLDTVDDLNTQAHIVSVILDILNPEQKEEEDFHIQIEKDPAQEDFLQGRMTGNPYKSTDVGLGPLMRDIKNKICRDTEMIALMEDDNGMELLVSNQIISLALPVRGVYDKLWKRTNPGQPMTIIYRMRGLLGDAVETFVSSLGEADGAVTKICFAQIHFEFCYFLIPLFFNSIYFKLFMSRFLLCQLRKLFELCVKTEQGRRDLVSSDAINSFMKVICKRNCSGSESVNKFCSQVSRVIGNLVLGNEEAEKALISMYLKTCQWKEIDETNDVSLRNERVTAVERLCEVTASILNSAEGAKLKQLILDSGVVFKACSHLVSNHPPLYSATESQEWKGFLLRPSLKLMLSFMHGMARSHEASQRALAEKTLHILHRLEQVASDNSIGTMAENVVEALRENKEVCSRANRKCPPRDSTKETSNGYGHA
uniref:UBR-type domain-containing protein n=1 Tax=Angiostrongylus cantonensis TaxID=6313 RepID=A0A0K0D9G1_ANGCA